MGIKVSRSKICTERALVVLVLVTLLPVFLGACADPHAYDGVNQAVADIDPGQIGTVVLNEKIGTAKPFGDPAGRHVVVLVNGAPAEAAVKAQHALSAAGFSNTNPPKGWERRKDGQYVALGLTIQPAGTQISWSGQTVPPGQAAVLLNLSRLT